MCSKNTLNRITTSAAQKSKQLLRDELISVILYGSYARGDNDEESDIDLLLLIDCPEKLLRAYRTPIADIASELSLDNGVTVSLLPFSKATYEKYKNAMPFLINIEKEGIKVA